MGYIPILYIQEIGVARRPTGLKISTFSIKDCENTFYMSGALARYTIQHYKIRIFFANEQHLARHCS